MSQNKKEESFLDSIITNLINYKEDRESFDSLHLQDRKLVKAVPLRYRIIADAFVFGLSLQEVNEALVRKGCPQLYARSPYDATLMYAFDNQLSYEEWKDLLGKSKKVLELISEDPHLSEGSISLSDIRAYVESNSSSCADGSLVTKHPTEKLYRSFSAESKEAKDFIRFLMRNAQKFSFVRESTRYYFCKYLMYYLETRKNDYVKALETGTNLNSAFRNLSVFRVQTALDRKAHSPQVAAERIDTVPVSFGEIYANFQTFYFEYTSIDWLNVLVDRYDLYNLNAKQERELAEYLRSYNSKLKNLSDRDVVEWYISKQEKKEAAADLEYSLDSGKKAYGVGRTGEIFLRNVLHGSVDLDRTTFLAFLLFFDKASDVPDEHKITENRLAEIVVNCKFPRLNTDENPIDDFFVEYLKTDDPMTFLLKEAEIMAMSKENFYLYKTYLNSKSEKKEFEKVTE